MRLIGQIGICRLSPPTNQHNHQLTAHPIIPTYRQLPCVHTPKYVGNTCKLHSKTAARSKTARGEVNRVITSHICNLCHMIRTMSILAHPYDQCSIDYARNCNLDSFASAFCQLFRFSQCQIVHLCQFENQIIVLHFLICKISTFFVLQNEFEFNETTWTLCFKMRRENNAILPKI
jgi:hypothetical protein